MKLFDPEWLPQVKWYAWLVWGFVLLGAASSLLKGHYELAWWQGMALFCFVLLDYTHYQWVETLRQNDRLIVALREAERLHALPGLEDTDVN